MQDSLTKFIDTCLPGICNLNLQHCYKLFSIDGTPPKTASNQVSIGGNLPPPTYFHRWKRQILTYPSVDRLKILFSKNFPALEAPIKSCFHRWKLLHISIRTIKALPSIPNMFPSMEKISAIIMSQFELDRNFHQLKTHFLNNRAIF